MGSVPPEESVLIPYMGCAPLRKVSPYKRCQDLKIDVPYGESPFMGVVFKGRCHPTGSVTTVGSVCIPYMGCVPLWKVSPYGAGVLL